ncbi:50S ribosomal protein L3 N(5)-glutamine methyltransferase [Endozoicomonas sp. SM1973]|uniref:Ribosomal protein uL3 glutamine methyltransferase n=1 Tax=Spartinivicinus marinus TaxID=2994442 RepID=A0A853I8S8_9GAMM|nr:50S ribosomal protein L3 N(5)-glutamine methyltransferase [Spartinivicinus marinus]NYZ66484.1 50S ribosomal protein L3 N(5)-glutamine methyltransferase [Spartinivicinus marinus]
MQLQQTPSFQGLTTIRDFIRWAYSRFNQADLFYGHGADNSWDEAVHLVLQSLALPWDIEQPLFDCHLTDDEKQHVASLINQRIEQRIPTAYLVNQAWFCGLPFYVDERVLVPRSPIAELINNQFRPWLVASSVDRVLDLCAGSGCIGIACAYAFPEAQVDIADISTDALQVATINVDQHELAHRVSLVQSDLYQALSQHRYQLIVSNPPYVDAEDMADMPAEFHHEPALGLEAGDDGLDLVKHILAKAADYLTDDGLLVVEVGNSQWALEEQFPQVPFTWVEFEQGGHGVFVLSAADCKQFQPVFQTQINKAV